MVEHDRVSVHRNGNALQLYLRKQFVMDSSFPLEAGMECVAHPAGPGLFIMPLDALEEYPVTVREPPPEAVPPAHRHLLNTDVTDRRPPPTPASDHE